MFMNDMCRCSFGVVTPVEDKRDLKKITYHFAMSEMFMTKTLMNGDVVHPTPPPHPTPFFFSELSKHLVPIEIHVHDWHVSMQLYCGDTCRRQTWFEESNIYTIL